MKPISLWAICMLFIVFSMPAQSQKFKFKLGEVTAEDFTPKNYPIDSSAHAVVLANIGSSEYEVDDKGGFNIIFQKHSRIRLLNRNAFDEATITIPLYLSGLFKDKIVKVEAYTYSLQGHELVKTKLEKSSIFEEKVNNFFMLAKFTMPNLTEGCIVDIKYSISSPFEHSLKDWYFQESIPVLYSEYSCSVPAIYDFVFIRQGFNPGKPVEKKTVSANFNLRNSGGSDRAQYYTLNTEVKTTKWVIENIPKTSNESFSNSVKNRVDKVEFQLSSIQYPNQPIQPVMNSWAKAAEQMLKRDDFGLELDRNPGWIKDELVKIVGTTETSLEAAKKIYYYVRDNFTCKDRSALYTNNNLKKVYQAKAGNVAEINLLLVTMLRTQGFASSPVILSTRDNGKAFEIYPVMDKFNYVICALKINDKELLLDASYSKMGFGKLHKNAYNNFGRMIEAEPVVVDMMPDSVMETQITAVRLYHNEKDELEGELSVYNGNNGSYNIREELTQKPIADYFKTTLGNVPSEYHATNATLDSLTKYEDPVKFHCDLKLDKAAEDIIYFSPILYNSVKENPFVAGERKYPVELESAFKDVFSLVMEIPKGYKVDEMPKSERVSFNENEGMFEYLVTKTGGFIEIKCTLSLTKATFEPEDYQNLREFFAHVVRKESEQIIFKKL